MSLTIKDVNGAIMFQSWTNAELDSMFDAVRFARAQLGKQNKRELTKGATVKFTSNRNGQTYTGTVEKVAIKYITVRTGLGLYRVPANMLEAA